MEKYEKVEKPLKDILLNNFVGGIFWTIGVTIGFALIIVFLSFIAKKIDIIPVIGDFASQVTSRVLQNLQSSPQLVK
ncbi:MAG: hypothetical protein A3B44_02045 [Candidatus Levybacteria bacterium RIFCSPLOWO2_01_FULL_38_21]|nr:MAG: hypothetical protein A3B44_02045 [Candidatus Levybacteria bacterium RIFCSPLOWO2_01_FULL_38_21]